jgi:hypothetical protein
MTSTYDLLPHTTHVRAFRRLDIYAGPWVGAIGQYRKLLEVEAKDRGIC